MSSKRLSISKRGDPNDAKTRNIRFDYSDIHLENELLNEELEFTESDIHRQKFLRNVDSEENYKKAKKDADVMLQLKNAVNSRKPHTSFDRVTKSAGMRPKLKATIQKEKTCPDLKGGNNDSEENVGDQVDSKRPVSETSSDRSSSEQEEEKPVPKPFNNLTMFLISLHRFKSAGIRNRNESGEAKEAQEAKEKEKVTPVKSVPSFSRPSSYVPRPTRARSAIQAGVAEKYGIHVKKDHSRSRRTLGEISKLEHDSKYGHIDKFEERRKRLLAACKNTQTLDLRIEKFLKEVDHFKKVSSPDNSLERVLMRSKSAYGVRGHPPSPW